MESFWALLKRAYHATFHHVSPKHLHRYANQFAGKNNIRNLDSLARMEWVISHMVGERLTYRELVG